MKILKKNWNEMEWGTKKVGELNKIIIEWNS